MGFYSMRNKIFNFLSVHMRKPDFTEFHSTPSEGSIIDDLQFSQVLNEGTIPLITYSVRCHFATSFHAGCTFGLRRIAHCNYSNRIASTCAKLIPTQIASVNQSMAVQGDLIECRTGNGEKLSSSQAEPV